MHTTYIYRIVCDECGDTITEFTHQGPINGELLSQGYLPIPEKDSNGNYVRVRKLTCYDCSFTVEEIAYHKDVAFGIRS